MNCVAEKILSLERKVLSQLMYTGVQYCHLMRQLCRYLRFRTRDTERWGGDGVAPRPPNQDTAILVTQYFPSADRQQ